MRWLWDNGIWGVEPPVGCQQDLAPVKEIPERNACNIVTQVAICPELLNELRRRVLTAVLSDSVTNRCFSFDECVVTRHCHVVTPVVSASYRSATQPQEYCEGSVPTIGNAKDFRIASATSFAAIAYRRTVTPAAAR